MQKYGALLGHPRRFGHLLFSSSFASALLIALAPQQFPVNLGDLLQAVFQCVVVFDPTTDLFYFIAGNDSARRTPAPERHRQVPYRPMALAFGALAGRIPAGHIALHQRAPQDVGGRRQLLRQTLAAPAQGQFGKPPESFTCLHLSASIHPNPSLFANPNLSANLPLPH